MSIPFRQINPPTHEVDKVKLLIEEAPRMT